MAAAITDIAGSSQWFERGFVTYSNQAKQDMLGVSAGTLKTAGAVSEETVREMALGALKNSQAQVAVAVSGIAGPDGGSPEKPVGTVCIGWILPDLEPVTSTEHFHGDRATVRHETVIRALSVLLAMLSEPSNG